MSLSVTAHPVLGYPTPAQAMQLGEMEFRRVMRQREDIVRAERDDPYAKGWEPPIWRVCDALLGFPWVDPIWAERMRTHLGFDHPVSILLINGGQRGGKSEWASKRVMRILRSNPSARAWALHSKMQMSVDYQQPLFWKYMPPDLRTSKGVRTQTTYVSYKQMTGFSEGKFVLPNRSDCSFLNYEMDRKSIEGGNLEIIWPDELVPADWVETMELRIAEKGGKMLITFTPVDGYTETVRLFQDGATVVKESIAYLCPKDGGPPDVARALGLTEEELEELKRAAEEKRAARCPQSRPENCDAWLENGRSGQLEMPPGREFQKIPRVMKCCDPEGKRAVVFFHSSDNPYGNPKNVWATIASKNRAFHKERFYGIGNKLYSSRFPKFSEKVHVIPDSMIPKEGENSQWVDPAEGRNFFMLWIRTVNNCAYVYREWPGSYYIEGVGVPGPWAMASGKKADGRPGPAQACFGFGYRRYKEEIARLEGWADVKSTRPDTMTDDQWDRRVKEWDEQNGTEEPLTHREIDSRAASAPRLEEDRPVTLLEELADWNLIFLPAPGDDISEGCTAINNALDYNPDKPVDFFNHPHLYVSAECRNLIYALQTWTGADGLKGATMDPIACLRYYMRRGLLQLAGTGEEDEDEETEGEYTGRETGGRSKQYY